MKIGFVLRPNANSIWGGDIKALNVIKSGMEQLNITVSFLSDVSLLSDEDLVFINNTTSSLIFSSRIISCFFRKPYCLIPFHEDFIKYDIPSSGLYRYVRNNLTNEKEKGCDFSIDRLIESPSLPYYFSLPPRIVSIENFEAIKNAKICITGSKIEKGTLLRDCPSAKAEVVYLTSGCEGCDGEGADEFLKLCDLKKGEYLLQVGRLERRKNQLSTVLATKDLDMPLVFISIFKPIKTDVKILIGAILKYRKAPTIIISQNLPAGQHKNLRIISMPNGETLKEHLLQSAFANCGLYIHPAFYELPGYVYLEAAKFGVSIIASKWTSIKEYFSDQKTGKYLLDDRISYVEPLEIGKMTELIKKNFGKRYPKNPDLWIYKRKPIDVAKEILNLIP